MAIKQDVIDILVEKSLKYQTRLVNSGLDFPALDDRPFIDGTYSRVYHLERVRYMVKPLCIEISKGVFATPTSLAREYLKLKYKPPKILHEQTRWVKGCVMPLFARPCHFPAGVYLDIKSAWWTIINVLGWNVDYYPLRWLLPGAAPDDFPWHENKIARSALVSVAQSNSIPFYNPLTHRIKMRPSYNVMLNWQVYAAISHVLHAIAFEAVHAGAHYVNTDGFIVEDENAEGVCRILDNWGLKYGSKARGEVWIFGPGSYKVGYKTTKRIIKPSPICNLYLPEDNLDFVKDSWRRVLAWRRIKKC